MEQKLAMLKEPMPPKGSLELYEKAAEIHKLAYKKGGMNSERYKKRMGYMLQNLFGKEVWTLKDLNDAQLKAVIGLAQMKAEKNGRLASIITSLD
jgi:hypothetical protein